MILQTWYDVTFASLQNLWAAFIDFIPKFVGAVIIFVIGWFVAMAIGKLVTKALNLIKLNQLFAKGNWDEALEKAGLKADVSGFVGAICKWVLVIVFLLAAVEVLGLGEFAGFLSEVISWLPNVIIAVIILVVAVIISDITEKIVVASVQKVKVGFANVAGAIVKWSIFVFAVLAILLQLGITPYLIQLLLTGLVAMLALGAGLAFGLGGKDAAAEIIAELRKKLKD